MINLSRIQLELERAKEGLREVEETIQKVEGKAFPNGPGRYNNLKVQIHSDKSRGLIGNEDGKLQRRTIASNIEPRNRRISSDDLSFNLKRGPRDKRDMGVKRQGFDMRPPSIAARLSGISQQSVDDEDDEEFTKKLTLPSRVITTVAEAPSRQEVIAAQTGDEVIKQRNRRMFGALVGTLQKFCKEETRVREREEKRLRVEKKLEENAKREKEKLMQEKRELFLERKRREMEIKRIEWSLNRVKEYEAWEAHVLPLKNFIQTHAKPHIFYLPSTHNSKTEERLAQSQKLVERMIEKRKNNLKEEIENSEKKAKRTVAEEEDEEEAENIPQNTEPVQNAEQAVDIDFDGVKKENGFHENDSKTQEDGVEQSVQAEESEKEGTWREENAEMEVKAESDSENPKEGDANEAAMTTATEAEETNVSNDVCDPSEAVESGGNNDEGGSDGGGEKNTDTGEGRTFDAEERNESNESIDDKKESDGEETHKVPVAETAQEDESAKECEAAPQEGGDVPGKSDEDAKKESESEVKKDDDPAKAANETKKDKDKSPERKSKRSYRSPRRSRSPRRFANTRRRSRSSSRRRKSYRRRSKSHSKSASPSKNPRRSRRRSERTSSSSRRKSPRRRRSSSKSSSSASPRKRMKYRSPSYSSSRSDSD